jgi:hypothetical protein
MKNCKELGLKKCFPCKSNIFGGECWVEFFARDISILGKDKIRDSIVYWINYTPKVSFYDNRKYLIAAIKHYYPEYEKLLVLL